MSGAVLAVSGGVMITLSRMNKILSVDHRNRRALVEAGCVNAWITNAVKAHGLLFAPDFARSSLSNSNDCLSRLSRSCSVAAGTPPSHPSPRHTQAARFADLCRFLGKRIRVLCCRSWSSPPRAERRTASGFLSCGWATSAGKQITTGLTANLHAIGSRPHTSKRTSSRELGTRRPLWLLPTTDSHRYKYRPMLPTAMCQV